MTQELSESGAKHLIGKLSLLDKYTNLGGVNLYIEEVTTSINHLKRNKHIDYEYPKLPPIADIPLDDLLKEIKRRVEYHPSPRG